MTLKMIKTAPVTKRREFKSQVPILWIYQGKNSRLQNHCLAMFFVMQKYPKGLANT